MEEPVMPEEGEVKPASKGNVPAADVDFGTVAKDVATAWTANPAITLLWTTSAVFTAESVAYNDELASRMQIGGNRPQITNALNTLDDEIDESLAYVKGYILEKYKKNAATSYYPAFGIIHKKKKYVFPTDRNNRLASLVLMIAGIHEHGFDAKEYGNNYWTEIKTQYDTLLSQATTTDGTVSTKVSSKNTLKESLKKKMNCLILAIKANYPDSYKAELRSWGFQKEKY